MFVHINKKKKCVQNTKMLSKFLDKYIYHYVKSFLMWYQLQFITINTTPLYQIVHKHLLELPGVL